MRNVGGVERPGRVLGLASAAAILFIGVAVLATRSEGSGAGTPVLATIDIRALNEIGLVLGPPTPDSPISREQAIATAEEAMQKAPAREAVVAHCTLPPFVNQTCWVVSLPPPRVPASLPPDAVRRGWTPPPGKFLVALIDAETGAFLQSAAGSGP